ncbi:DUF5330 domain-containing protein [Flexibacterium corallicola]|uniref:DUF5330 domain-containing protein n=1 Tax=Flexibacterium corallicola TaxID=3037259 RepID=UPI00286F5CBB|nr:DUF5330 domain-containing protein [Pseudovibrio sp. M1P-2-3]
MYFLLKVAFWLSLILLIVPIGIGSDDEAPSINVVQAFVAARSAISDMSGFCDRNPDTCETGSSVATLIGLKAKQAARLTYDYLVEDEATPDVEAPQQHVTPVNVNKASRATLAASEPEPSMTGTLTSTDKEIPWGLEAVAAVGSSLLSGGQDDIDIAPIGTSSLPSPHISGIPFPRPDPRL